MIDIDCGAWFWRTRGNQPCSMVMDCRPGLWIAV
jgi:hypothetical protein